MEEAEIPAPLGSTVLRWLNLPGNGGNGGAGFAAPSAKDSLVVRVGGAVMVNCRRAAAITVQAVQAASAAQVARAVAAAGTVREQGGMSSAGSAEGIVVSSSGRGSARERRW